MTSAIDPTKPIDGVPASKADLRANLQSAKDEIEALQTGKFDRGHTHTHSAITDAGALAGLDQVGTAEIADAAATGTRIAADPLVILAANAVDVSALATRDGGATWYGSPGGQDCS